MALRENVAQCLQSADFLNLVCIYLQDPLRESESFLPVDFCLILLVKRFRFVFFLTALEWGYTLKLLCLHMTRFLVFFYPIEKRSINILPPSQGSKCVGQSQSRVTTDDQTSTPSWCRTPLEAHDHILVWSLELYGCAVLQSPFWRKSRPVLCQKSQSLSVVYVYSFFDTQAYTSLTFAQRKYNAYTATVIPGLL